MTNRTTGTTRTVLITGANRGIGLEFVKQFKSPTHSTGDRPTRVVATARDHEKAPELATYIREGDTLLPLDVADERSCQALAQALDQHPIDILINNAGMGSSTSPVTELDTADLLRVLDVNAVGPMRVVKHLMPSLRAGQRKLIVNISSQLGSIANNNGGSSYAYRSSKACLNMLTRHLAVELADEHFTVITAHPGWVQTDMGGPNATLTTEQSVHHLITNVIEPARPNTHNGTYRNYDGSILPW